MSSVIEPTRVTQGATLAVTSAAPLLVLANFTAPMVTLPQMARSLGAGPTGPVWMLGAIALGLSSLLLVSGGLADDHGRRRVLVAGSVVLAVASVLGAAAPSVPVFVAARLVQGGASAAMLAASLGILGHAFPSGPERVRATGRYGAMLGLGTLLGPLVSGALAALTGWRAVYALVGVAAAALAAIAARTLEESRSPAPRRFDVPGVVLLSLGVAALVAGVTEGRAGWSRPVVPAAFVLAAVLLAAFVAVERRRAEPLLDLTLFRRPAFLLATGSALVVGGAIVGLLNYLPTVLQVAHGLTPLATALLFAVWSGPSFAGALLTRHVRLGSAARLAAGLGLTAAGFAALLGVGATLSLPLVVAGLVVSGVGSGLINSAITHLAVESVPAHRVSMGSGANNTARYVGSSLGAAGVAAVVGALGRRAARRWPWGLRPAHRGHGRGGLGLPPLTAARLGHPSLIRVTSGGPGPSRPGTRPAPPRT
ncbi:MFS transporter [Actinomadura sp. ATCC 31491]|uniref:MFS transporter n=1 Tax=Actinomadura luzonensis TaxID=2805427 RepID=A0ABT0FZM1_9ACTN|nr:MFS transporter [Actinomadura luzonensis]MCK2217765.1 MFS transporter [Actinomadura luzonensis]